MTEPDAPEKFSVITFDPLATTSAVSTLPSDKFRVDPFGVNLHASRKTLEEGDDTWTMRLTGGSIGEQCHTQMVRDAARLNPAAAWSIAFPKPFRQIRRLRLGHPAASNHELA